MLARGHFVTLFENYLYFWTYDDYRQVGNRLRSFDDSRRFYRFSTFSAYHLGSNCNEPSEKN